MKTSIKKLEKQWAFILAFINEDKPMNKNYALSPNQSEYNDSDKEDYSPVSTLHSP